MKKLRTEIIIEAPVSRVWDVLMNHSEYPTWNPFIKKIIGESSVGNVLEITVLPEGKSAMNFKPIVLVNEPHKEFRWKGKLYIKGLFDGEHYFILEKINDQSTRFIHGENFSGILVGLLMNMIGDSTEKGFKDMNNALKTRAEKS